MIVDVAAQKTNSTAMDIIAVAYEVTENTCASDVEAVAHVLMMCIRT